MLSGSSPQGQVPHAELPRAMAARLRGAFAGAGLAAVAGAAAYRVSSVERLPPVDGALEPGKLLVCRLEAEVALSADTSRYRFALPTADHVLGLPTASHVLAVDAGNTYRAYTPVTCDADDRGYFDLVVKRYDNGYFSDMFRRLEVGGTMGFRGPVVTLPYAPNAVARVAMVCGGTGVTPMYQILRAALRDPADATTFALLYANRTPGDILLRDELDALARRHPDRLVVRYVVDAAAAAAADWPPEAVGRLDAAKVAQALPPPDAPSTVVLVCGPKGLLDHLCGPAAPPRARDPDAPLGGVLGALGFDRRRVVRFE